MHRSPVIPSTLATTLATTVVALAGASCDFFGEVPPGAVLLCANDAACPEGNACDLATHVCVPEGVVNDVAPPAIVSAASSARAARDGDEVTITVVADEPLAAATLVLAPGVADPGFLPAVLDEESATFRVVVGSATPAGSYVVDALVLRDATGNEARRPVDAVSFRVDRTAPRVFSLSARSASLDEPVASDIAPNNVVVVTFEADEEIVFAGAAFADLLPGFDECAPDDGVALGFSCILTVTSEVSNGVADVTVQVRDVAGNVTDEVTSVTVDTAAPAVLPGSARVTLREPDGDPASAIVPGGAVEVSFDVDEPLFLALGTPTIAVTLTLPGALEPAPMAVTVAGNRTSVSAVLSGANVTLEGDATITVSLADEAGHTRTQALPLSSPFQTGIPVVASAPSACQNLAPGGCPDVDGDGALGLDDDCLPALGDDIDCDDADRTSLPGGVEIPNDGRDNDCVGGDLVLDQSVARVNAVFVDCSAEFFEGDPTCLDGVADAGDGDGSATAPWRDLLLALDDAEARGVPLIARGVFDMQNADVTLVSFSVPVHGGFLREGDAWVRVPAGAEGIGSVLLRNGSWVVAAGASAVEFNDSTVQLLPNVTVVHSFLGTARAQDGLRAIECSGSHIEVSAGARVLVAGGFHANVIGSEFSDLRIHHVDIVNPLRVEGSATVVGLRGGLDFAGDDVRIFSSTLRGGPAIALRNGDLLVVNSTIAADSRAAFEICDNCDAVEQRWSLVAASVSREPGAVLYDDGAQVIDDGAAFLACTATSCESITGSEVVANGAPVTVSGVDPFALGAPPAAVADRNGDCTRLVDGSYAVGFDAP